MEEQITYDSLRPVEWLAVFRIIHGFIPSSAFRRSYTSSPDVYRVPHQGGRAVSLNRDDGMTMKEDGHTNWKQCGHCGERWPPTPEYWHRDSKGRNGLHSFCVYCRCEAEQVRYRRNRNSDE